ncbi:MAG: hypothetical protein AAF654_06795 [Myxococcota bacterium]
MKKDIRELMSQEKIGDFGYQELQAVERGRSVRARWRLIAASDQIMAAKAAKTTDAGPRRGSRLFDAAEG